MMRSDNILKITTKVLIISLLMDGVSFLLYTFFVISRNPMTENDVAAGLLWVAYLAVSVLFKVVAILVKGSVIIFRFFIKRFQKHPESQNPHPQQ